MLNDIKAAFMRRVNGISWMDAETKKVTLEKSREMLSFIGFPKWLLEKGAIEEYYGNVIHVFCVLSYSYFKKMVYFPADYRM